VAAEAANGERVASARHLERLDLVRLVNKETLTAVYSMPNVRLINHHMPWLDGYLKGGNLRSPMDLSISFASEQTIDELAYAVRMDPVAFRRRNMVGGGGIITALDPMDLRGAVGVWGQGAVLSPGVVGKGGPPGVVPGEGIEGADGVQGWGTSNFSGVAGFGDPTNIGNNGTGVFGLGGSPSRPGVRGIGAGGQNVSAPAGNAVGVFGQGGSGNSDGVFGIGSGTGAGVHGRGGSTGLADHFEGGVSITGNLNVSGTVTKGGGALVIDHPLDPENKYLAHSFVESPDMKNVYDGVVIADSFGEADIELPAYFDALNKDFRYQLTPIGVPAPNLHIKDEISGNRFSLAGAASGQRVCWQVTGSGKTRG
jgi:hypothetical protein